MRYLACVGAMALAASAAVADAPARSIDGILAGRTAGMAQPCLNVRQARDSTIVGDAILYRDGGTIWVNRPKAGAQVLQPDLIMTRRSTETRTCADDTIDLSTRYSNVPMGFVVLGDFIPYRRAR